MLIEKTETKWKEAGMAYFCIKNVWLNDASVILDWFVVKIVLFVWKDRK